MTNSSQQALAPGGVAGMARRPSGLIVPDSLAMATDAAQPGPVEATDLDGRRRVVFTDTERRQIDRTIMLLRSRGYGVIVGCARPGGCGQVAIPEGSGTPDAGYGCGCSRTHWAK